MAKWRPLTKLSNTTWRWSLRNIKGFGQMNSLKCYGHTKWSSRLLLGKHIFNEPTESRQWSLWNSVYLHYGVRPITESKIMLFNDTNSTCSKRNTISWASGSPRTKGGLRDTSTQRLKKEGLEKTTSFYKRFCLIPRRSMLEYLGLIRKGPTS